MYTLIIIIIMEEATLMFDVDDILLNVIGSTIGYLLYLVYKHINKNFFDNKLQISKVID